MTILLLPSSTNVCGVGFPFFLAVVSAERPQAEHHAIDDDIANTARGRWKRRRTDLVRAVMVSDSLID